MDASGITDNSSNDVQVGAGSGNSGGIVFDGDAGTVYGNVTLQDDLTIGEGESLNVPEGATLNTGSYSLTVDGGTLTGTGQIIGTVNYAPTITTTGLSGGTVDTAYSQTLTATGDETITWSSSDLPTWLMLNENTGEISGTPATANTYSFTVTAENDYGNDSKEFSITIGTVSVTGVSLNKDSLTLKEGSSDTLTATVTPTNAANQKVTWESSNTSVATVDANGKVSAVSAGAVTITVKTENGSFEDTCSVTVEHGSLTNTSAKAATCTEEGYTGDKVCGICKEVVEKGEIIPANGHTYKDGKCTVCGEVDPDFEEVSDVDDTKLPQNGDNSNMTLWMALLFVSGAGVTAMVIVNRKVAKR